MDPISLTENAKKNLLRLRDDNNISKEYCLRVGVQGGNGCGGNGGFKYIMGFDQKTDKDNEYDIDGITVYINKAESLYLLGMVIDWQEEGDIEGFTFNNPQAAETDGYDFSI